MTGSQIFIILLIVGIIAFVIWINRDINYDDAKRRADKGEILRGQDVKRILRREGRKKDLKNYK